MRLTTFGERVRILRMRYRISLKAMADAMGISSSHLSGMEYGEKALGVKHISAAIEYLRPIVTAEELREVTEAASASQHEVDISTLTSRHRWLVAAFARRLQEGQSPPQAVERWVDSRLLEDEPK